MAVVAFLATLTLHADLLLQSPDLLAPRAVCVPALLALFAPSGRYCRRHDAIAFIAGCFAGLWTAYAWLEPVLHRVGGLSHLGAVLLLSLIGALVSAQHVALAMCAGLLVRTVGPVLGCAAGGLLVAAVERAVVLAFPWYEPLTTYFLGIGAPGAARVVGWLGPDALTVLIVSASVLVWSGSRRPTVAALVLLLLAGALGEAVAPAVARCDVELSVVGLQRGPPVTGPEWPRRQLEAYLALEEGVQADVVVWPEGAYPYRERIEAGDGLERLPPSEHYTRVLGMVGRNFFGGPLENGVVVQRRGWAAVEVRYKYALAPFEDRRLAAAERPDPVLSVEGFRVALPICYEILDRSLMRLGRPDLVLSVSADDFDPSGHASYLLARATRLRALELRVPVVRVSTISWSVAYQADGRLAASLAPGTERLHATLCAAPSQVWSAPAPHDSLR